MTLTLAEQYVAESTLYLYNQILDVQFYSILYKTKTLLVAWNSKDNQIAQIFGEWDYEEDDVDDLDRVILNILEERDLTNIN